MEQEAIQRDTRTSKAYIKVISISGLCVFAYALYGVVAGEFNFEWLLLSLVTIVIVSRADIQIPKTSSTVTISDTFIFISILLYGVLPSVVLAGADAAYCSLHYKNRRKVIPFNTAVTSLSVFVSGTVVMFLFDDLKARSGDWSKLILAAETMALIQYVLNSGMVSVVNALRAKRNLFKTWHDSFLWTSISYFAGAVAACLIVKLVAVISFYAFIIAVPILAITYLTYKSYLTKVQASARHAEDMAELHLRTIEALAIAIDAKDEVTHDHVHRVQIYATGLARLFGLSEPEIEALKAGALLHDIGKLAVPDYILNKPGKLTPAEFDKMKVHTVVGAEILNRVGFPYPVVPVVRHHHERWDGQGYPDGLKKQDIPITARILSVVDCFDSAREDRQYRKALTREEAIELLKANRGTMYDPKIIDAFLDHLPEFEDEIQRRNAQRPLEEAKQDRRSRSAGNGSDSAKLAFDSIRSAHREVITLYEIAQSVGTSLDLGETFSVFSSRLQEMVGYTTCVLYLLKRDSNDVEAAHASGLNAEIFKGRKMASGTGISGWVAANGHPMHNSDPRMDLNALKLELDDQYRSSVVVPLLKEDEVLGALALYCAEKITFQPEHIRLVEAVAKLASDAIANALHHERTETSALTDALTGLANARALRRRFEQRSEQARRCKESFSVLMMDLDGFKEVNDRLGHQAGDDVLKQVARLLSSHVRSSDFLGRYAGDEFVAMVEAKSDELPDLVHRLQKAVDDHDFKLPGISVVGLSMGWACFGVDGSTLDELLIAADRAMYANKAKRKARLSGADEINKSDVGSYTVM